MRTELFDIRGVPQGVFLLEGDYCILNANDMGQMAKEMNLKRWYEEDVYS